MEREKSDFNARLRCLLLKLHRRPLRNPRLDFSEDFRRSLEHNRELAGDSFENRSVFPSEWTFLLKTAVVSRFDSTAVRQPDVAAPSRNLE